MKKSFIVIFIILILFLIILKVRTKKEDNFFKNIVNENTINDVVIEEKDGLYIVKAGNEIKYYGEDSIEAELYRQNPDFDLKMPNFDE